MIPEYQYHVKQIFCTLLGWNLNTFNISHLCRCTSWIFSALFQTLSLNILTPLIMDLYVYNTSSKLKPNEWERLSYCDRSLHGTDHSCALILGFIWLRHSLYFLVTHSSLHLQSSVPLFNLRPTRHCFCPAINLACILWIPPLYPFLWLFHPLVWVSLRYLKMKGELATNE